MRADTLCSGILLTGGIAEVGGRTTELYIPFPCPGQIQHCRLPDIAPTRRYAHTQDQFMACGGHDFEYSCSILNPVSGTWEPGYTWDESIKERGQNKTEGGKVDLFKIFMFFKPKYRYFQSIQVYFEPFPKRVWHVSWMHNDEVFLMGGQGGYATSGTTTSLLPQPPGSSVVPGFPLNKPTL